MTDLAEQRRYLQQVDATAARLRAALGQRTPTSDRVAGALFTYLGPRILAADAMPDLNEVTAGLDRSNFRQRRRMIGDRIRKMTRDRLGRDADLSDIDQLLDALCEQEEGDPDGMDRGGRRHGRDEVDRPGYPPTKQPSEDPWPEAQDDLDDDELMEIIEQLEGKVDDPTMNRLRRAAASDRRRARDEETPAESFDRRRQGRDGPPPFPGMPRPGGSMVPNPSSVDRPGFSQPRDIAAKDKRRRFGQDSAGPRSFANRFGFTRRTTSEDQTKIPGRAGGVW